MREHTASCSCGAVRARCKGEPVRRSICSCQACRQRTGSAFSFNITYDAGQVQTSGAARTYTRRGNSGRTCTYSFCPDCGATVFYALESRPGRISIPAGAFGEANLFEPAIEVYRARREAWLRFEPSCGLAEE